MTAPAAKLGRVLYIFLDEVGSLDYSRIGTLNEEIILQPKPFSNNGSRLLEHGY